MKTEPQSFDLFRQSADEPTPDPSQEGNSPAVWCDKLPSRAGNSVAVRSCKLPSLGGVGGGFIARAWNTVAAGLLGCTLLVSHNALAKDTSAEKQDKPKIDVCFVLDTTGSMSGLIEGAKQKIWSIANEITSARPTPDIRIGLIGYRDRGDEYVTAQTIRNQAARKGIEYGK